MTETLKSNLLFLVDDVFVRKDLYEGKYAPDMQALKKFEEVMEKLQLSAEEEKKDNEEIAMKNMKVEKEEL